MDYDANLARDSNTRKGIPPREQGRSKIVQIGRLKSDVPAFAMERDAGFLGYMHARIGSNVASTPSQYQ